MIISQEQLIHGLIVKCIYEWKILCKAIFLFESIKYRMNFFFILEQSGCNLGPNHLLYWKQVAFEHIQQSIMEHFLEGSTPLRLWYLIQLRRKLYLLLLIVLILTSVLTELNEEIVFISFHRSVIKLLYMYK